EFELGILQVVQDRLAALEIDPPGLSEAQGPAVAIEKSEPQPLFDIHHMLADHRGREVQAVACRDEAARLDDLPEHLDARQRIHSRSLPLGYSPKPLPNGRDNLLTSEGGACLLQSMRFPVRPIH